MLDLQTDYLGLKLENPLVPSASPLSRSLDSARRLEDAGAGALVMYSLFEEEIQQDETQMLQHLLEQQRGHAEADSFLPLHDSYRSAEEQYLEQLRRLKQGLDIPVIASLNGVTPGGWLSHATALQEAGADALELNVYYIAADAEQDSRAVEARYLKLLGDLRGQIDIPVAVKLGPQLSSVPNLVRQLEQAGAAGVTLFNRFYQPDIDLDSLRVTHRLQLSSSNDTLLAMRWIAILYGRVGLSLAATGGVHTAEDALKMLAAGADVVQLCSALLEYGPAHLHAIKAAMINWLEQRGYTSLTEFRGSVSQSHIDQPGLYERANYLMTLSHFDYEAK